MYNVEEYINTFTYMYILIIINVIRIYIELAYNNCSLFDKQLHHTSYPNCYFLFHYCILISDLESNGMYTCITQKQYICTYFQYSILEELYVY